MNSSVLQVNSFVLKDGTVHLKNGAVHELLMSLFFIHYLPDSAKNLWQASNVLLQKLPAEQFRATIRMTFRPNNKLENEKAGQVIMGFSYANLALTSKKDGIYLTYTVCKDAVNGKPEYV